MSFVLNIPPAPWVNRDNANSAVGRRIDVEACALTNCLDCETVVLGFSGGVLPCRLIDFAHFICGLTAVCAPALAKNHRQSSLRPGKTRTGTGSRKTGSGPGGRETGSGTRSRKAGHDTSGRKASHGSGGCKAGHGSGSRKAGHGLGRIEAADRGPAASVR